MKIYNCMKILFILAISVSCFSVKNIIRFVCRVHNSIHRVILCIILLLFRIRKRLTGISTGIRRSTWTTPLTIRRRRSDTLWSMMSMRGRRTSSNDTDSKELFSKIWSCFTFLLIRRSSYYYQNLSEDVFL